MSLLTTERLILRPLREADLETMFDYRNHPDCARYQRGQTKDRANLQKLIQRRQFDRITVDEPFMAAVETRQTGEMVGEIVVMPNMGTITLGYTFSYRHHRKGYAFEALSALTELLHQRYPEWDFVCFTDRENVASMALLKKLGYRDMGYAPNRDSQVFGKWLNPETEAEIAAAVAKNPS